MSGARGCPLTAGTSAHRLVFSKTVLQRAPAKEPFLYIIGIMDNIFLKIIRREAPSYPVYEDRWAFAFLDIEPYSKGHTLIVPKSPCPDIAALDEQTASAILMAAKKVVIALQKRYGYNGIVLHQVNGETAQEIRQFHLHVYGTLSPGSPHYFTTLPREPFERETLFSSIAKELSSTINVNSD